MLRCLSKRRNAQGKITGYIMLDTSTNTQAEVSPIKIRSMLEDYPSLFENLKLSANGRIITATLGSDANGFVFFHQVNEPNGYLSNWYTCKFIDNRNAHFKEYKSVEQYMMCGKAILFDCYDIAEKIMKTTDSDKIKALGREVRGFNDIIWDAHKEEIVYNGLYLKFTQNENLRKMLKSTGNKILAECAVKDKIWGIGLSMHDKRRFDTNQWRGQNLLGKLLMQVRNNI